MSPVPAARKTSSTKSATHEVEPLRGDPWSLCIPATAWTLDGFVAWATSDNFPRRGRIAFINREIFIDMSPEEFEKHNKVKTAVISGIYNVNEEADLGELYSDRSLVTNEAADLSTEPDGTFVTWRSYRAKRVELIPRKDAEGEYMELRGRPDWMLEVVSRWSYAKDTQVLRAAYHRARIPEYWLIDALGDEIDFQILTWRRRDYVAVTPVDGWLFSRVFGRFFRLERRRNRMGRWNYKLLVRPA